MGKQPRPRRRNRRQNKNNPTKGKPGTNKSNTGTSSDNHHHGITDPSSQHPHGVVTARIRHGDPRVRAGALSALACTLFSPEALSSASAKHKQKHNNKKHNPNEINAELLKAISEKILDHDSLVSKNAAGCWNNLILFGQQQDTKHIQDIDIGAILTTRIQTCCTQIMSLLDKLDSLPSSSTQTQDMITTETSESSTTNHKKSNNNKNAEHSKKKQTSDTKQLVSNLASQFDIASVCLQTLCGLIESIPEAVDRFTSHLIEIDPTSSLGGIGVELKPSVASPVTHILLQILVLGTRALTSSSTSSHLNTVGPAAELIGESMTFASRSLHAILDENLPLSQWFLTVTASPSPTAQANANSLNVLSTVIQGGTFSSKTRLHCCGTLITLRNIISSSSSPTNNNNNEANQESTSTPQPPPFLNELTQLCIDVVLPLLIQYLEYHPDIATAMAQRVATKLYALEEEMQDERMEKKIIQQLKNKKESARLIARRQKEAKKSKKEEEKRQKTKKQDEEDMAVEVEGNTHGANNNEMDTDGKKDDNHKDDSTNKNAQEEYENSVKAWENAYSPVKLALEVATNFCAGSSNITMNIPPQGDDDDDVMMYDSDLDEEQIMMNADTEADTASPNPFDIPIMDAVVKSNLPERVLSLLLAVSAPLKLKNENATNSSSVPQVVRLDISQIKSKCGACLGNIVSTLPPTWGNEESTIAVDGVNRKTLIITIWEALRAAMNISSTTTPADNDDTEGMAGLSNAMSSLLRSRPQILTLYGFNIESEVQFLLQLLKSMQNNNNGSTTETKKWTEKDAAIEDLMQNIVALLGSICTGMNSKSGAFLATSKEVSITLIEIVSNSNSPVSVQNEILNLFMDIYGNDDNAGLDKLFESLQMMQVFEKTLPLFKRSINNARGAKEGSEEDIFQWKETALNGSRFIKYKRDQMKL